MMQYAASSTSNPSGVQGLCPSGWHIPSDDEWTELVNIDAHTNSLILNKTAVEISNHGLPADGLGWGLG